MTTSLMPTPQQRYFNNNGSVAAGCLLYTYAAGSSTPKATYTDSAGTIPHANPIVLNSKGEAVIYFSGSYKIDLKTSEGVQITGYPVDNYAYSATAADTLRTDLAASSGAGLVGGIATGAGAVIRTLQVKNRDILSPQDKGAIADGVANDASALSNVEAELAFTIAPKGTYKSTATVPLTYMLANAGAVFSSDQLFGYTVKSGANINGGKYSTTGGVVFNFATGSKQSVRGVVITDDSAANATAVNINAASIIDAMVTDSNIQARGYGVLTNSSATNLSGLVISNNIIKSDESDAVEINAPGITQSNIVIASSVLKAGAAGTNVNSGFLVGIARARGVVLIGTSGIECRQEAHHFEDDQHTNTVVGNVALEVGEAGHSVGQSATALGEGMPVVGNSYRAKSGSVDGGLYSVSDANGSVHGMSYACNRLVNFKYGILAGVQGCSAFGNVIDNASGSAIHSVGGNVYGQNIARNCITLASSSRHSIIGKIDSITTPTALLTVTDAGKLGSVLKGFSFPITGLTTANGATWTQALFPTPTRQRGRLTALVTTTGNDHIYFSADVLWNGTTLTVSDPLFEETGIFGGSRNFTESGGNINLTVFTASASAASITVDFDGDYYQAP